LEPLSRDDHTMTDRARLLGRRWRRRPRRAAFPLLAMALAGCSAAQDPATDTSDVTGADPSSTGIVAVGVDAGESVQGITVSPIALTPPFSPAITDYTVRCAAGLNTLEVTTTYPSGDRKETAQVLPDQAIVVDSKYWIRCLPPNFPPITVTTYPQAGPPTAGYYLVSSGAYALALDTNGTPVWYARATSVLNVDALTPNAISFVPNSTGPFGTASAAERYEIHALDTLTTTVITALDAPTDDHELRLLPNGDHLLLAYPLESGIDLTGLATYGPGQTVADCEIQEVDPSGRLVWSWLASDHVDPVRESIEPATSTVGGATVIDVFHCNAIEVDGEGNLLLSMRHANALFYIDRSTGQVAWKLGGNPYSKDGAACVQVTGDSQGTFSMQHDARFVTAAAITLFDDHGGAPGVARGVEYAIDLQGRVATPTFQFLGTAQSQYEGSFRRYPDGHSVVGWGYVSTDPRAFTEVDAEGNDVLDVALGAVPSYRAIKVPIAQLDLNLLRASTAK
jgi:hypothetical protein